MSEAGARGDALRLKLSGVEVNQMLVVGAIPGVYPLAAAARNGTGTGTIQSTGDGTLLSWKAPGSATAGTPIPASVDGSYLLQDGVDLDKWLRVQVVAAYLVSAGSAQVTLRDSYNGLGPDDVTAAEATAGSVETLEVTMSNDSGRGISRLVAWIDAAVSDLEISDDGAAWVSPTSEAAGLAFPDLAAGATDIIHLRRTIGAAAGSDTGVLNHLHFAWQGL